MKKCPICGKEHSSTIFEMCYDCREKTEQDFTNGEIPSDNLSVPNTLKLRSYNNKVASKLSIAGIIFLILGIVVGITIMLEGAETTSYYYDYSTVSEWSHISVVYGGSAIVSGIIIYLIFKAIAEVVENTDMNLQYQNKILITLSKLERDNHENCIQEKNK